MNVEELIDKWPTESEVGFSSEELQEVVSKLKAAYPNKFSTKHFYNALRRNTVQQDMGKIRTYHCDTLMACNAGLNAKELYNYEID